MKWINRLIACFEMFLFEYLCSKAKVKSYWYMERDTKKQFRKDDLTVTSKSTAILLVNAGIISGNLVMVVEITTTPWLNTMLVHGKLSKTYAAKEILSCKFKDVLTDSMWLNVHSDINPRVTDILAVTISNFEYEMMETNPVYADIRRSLGVGDVGSSAVSLTDYTEVLTADTTEVLELNALVESQLLDNIHLLGVDIFDDSGKVELPLRKHGDYRLKSGKLVITSSEHGSSVKLVLGCPYYYAIDDDSASKDPIDSEEYLKVVNEVFDVSFSGKSLRELSNDRNCNRLISFLFDTPDAQKNGSIAPERLFSEYEYDGKNPTRCIKTYLSTGGFSKDVLKSLNSNGKVHVVMADKQSSFALTAYYVENDALILVADESGKDIGDRVGDDRSVVTLITAHAAVLDLFSKATKIAEKHFRYGDKQ